MKYLIQIISYFLYFFQFTQWQKRPQDRFYFQISFWRKNQPGIPKSASKPICEADRENRGFCARPPLEIGEATLAKLGEKGLTLKALQRDKRKQLKLLSGCRFPPNSKMSKYFTIDRQREQGSSLSNLYHNVIFRSDSTVPPCVKNRWFGVTKASLKTKWENNFFLPNPHQTLVGC